MRAHIRCSPKPDGRVKVPVKRKPEIAERVERGGCENIETQGGLTEYPVWDSMSIMQASNQIIEATRRAFHATGWSILRLAREAGVSYAMAHGVINGTREPTLSTLVRLLGGLGYELRLVKRKG